MDETEGVVNVRASSAMLWTGILAPPIAWAIDVQVNYALIQYICFNSTRWIFWAVTALMLAICVIGAFEARRGMARDDSKRARFMGHGGLFIAASFFLAILCTTAAFVLLGPCD